MKSKKRIVIVIVAIVIIVLLVIGAVFAFSYLNKDDENTSGLKVDSNVMFDEKEAEDYGKDRVASINVNIYQTLKLAYNEDGTANLKVGLHNGNEHQYMFSVTVDNKEIYRSDLIPAGASIDEMKVSGIDLEAGNYNAVVMFTVVSEEDNQTALGSTGVEVPLQVTK